MLIKKTELCRLYRITTGTLNNYIKSLPDDIRKELNINGKRYYNTRQLMLIKENFGDWNKHSFKTKGQMCIEYGVSRTTFKKILKEIFGESEFTTGKLKLFTSKQVEIIESKI